MSDTENAVAPIVHNAAGNLRAVNLRAGGPEDKRGKKNDCK